MTRQQSRPSRTFNVLSHKTRVLKVPAHCESDDLIEVILREQSRLLVEGSANGLQLSYVGKAGGEACIALTEGATAWIDSWHSHVSAITIRIEIGSRACVGIDEKAMTSASCKRFSIAFASSGTGRLTAVWQADQAISSLRISGMVAGDQLNLAMRDSAGALQNVVGTCIDDDADQDSTGQNTRLALPLRGLEAARFEWSEPASNILPLPTGHLWQPLDDAVPNKAGNGLRSKAANRARHTSAGTARTRLVRACLTPTAWMRLAPVIFEANALGPGIPKYRIALAPGQPIRCHNRIMLAQQLVNGQLITQYSNSHQLCYARPSELEQSEFDYNGVTLVPAVTPSPTYYEIERCREQMLAYTAYQCGMSLIDEPALRLELGGLSIDAIAPVGQVGIWHAKLPETVHPGSDLHIVSRSASARDTTSFTLEDDRVLGVALTDVVIHDTNDSRNLDLSNQAWTGLHQWEYRRGRALRWTNGLATLPSAVHQLRGGETIELHVAALHRYWANDSVSDDEEGAA